MKSFTFAALAAAASCAMAQDTVAAYGQCGGQNYSGATACAQGYMCHVYNEFYSQCIAGDSSAASQGVTTASQVASSSAPVVVASTPVAIVSTPVAVASSSAVAASSSVVVSSSVSAVSKVAVSSSKSVVVSSSTPATSSVATTLQTKAVTSTSSSSTAAAVTTASAAVSTTTSSSNSTNPSASGTQFTIDGETGYFPGTNSYWISFLTNNSDVDLVMQHLADSGLKILRVWGFNDVTTTPTDGTVYFQTFAGTEPVINTGADGLERLDYVVKSAEAHGIKLIINFVNNWTDYGGMAAYFTYAGISDNTEWYNNTLAQTQYQKYIKTVVSRYSNSTAIFGWELANEPRCTSCDLSVLKTWVSDTAAYIKTLDSAHMVTTGEEGFGLSDGDDGSYPYTTGAGGSNFTANCADPNIDFCTYHLYPESWGTSPTQEWGNEWITNHNTACAAVGKPCLLEEFGASDNCTIESSWQATALAASATSGDLFWQLGDTLSTGETYQDGNTVYYQGDLWSCLVTDHVEAVDAA